MSVEQKIPQQELKSNVSSSENVRNEHFYIENLVSSSVFTDDRK